MYGGTDSFKSEPLCCSKSICKLTAARYEKATVEYVKKVKDDMTEAHRANERYWQTLKNIGMWIYLTLSSALVILEMLARNLGWF